MTNLLAITTLLLQYSDKIASMAKLMNTATAEGRDVSDAELDALFADDDAARARLVALIAAANP